MQKEAIHAFTARITQASKTELTVITYEMALTEIKEAKDAYEIGNISIFNRELGRAKDFIGELMAALDYQYTLSYDLLSLYLYVNKRIITAMFKKDPAFLDSAESVLKKLLNGFERVSREDTSGPVMKNTQKLYAGLTYSKGKLNETYIDSDNRSRGFIA
jgi:flagellar protein FliS